MKQKLITGFAGIGAVAATAAVIGTPALAGAAAPKVTVRVEGLGATVLPARSVAVPTTGSITTGGVKAGLCPAASAQGALQKATGGRWKGKWYASYHEYLVSSILGSTPDPKKDYYEIFINNVVASAGACELKLKAGDQLLFAAVPDSGRAQTPLGITWTASGGKLRAKVLAYDAKGRGSALRGAKVTEASGSAVIASAVTGANGVATFTAPSQAGTESLVATATDHIRAEATVTTSSSSL